MCLLYQLSLARSTSTLFFHLPRACVPTERGLGVGSSPRPVDYCSTRMGIRAKNGAHAPPSCALYLAAINDRSSNAIHPSAWNRNSAKFAVAISPALLHTPVPIGRSEHYLAC